MEPHRSSCWKDPAFLASVAFLAMYKAQKLAVLIQVTTVMAVETLLGTDASFVAEEKHILLGEDSDGTVRQGIVTPYLFRTTTQFPGSQVEDVMVAVETIRVEARQDHSDDLGAMSIRQRAGREEAALAVPDRTELIQPSMNGGLAVKLVASDLSLNFRCKVIEIGSAVAPGLAHPLRFGGVVS
ncbi:unnamed protein product [Tilletia laevis]|uniref:Uncharacterized protein n=1 Tax=Tilletia laevis TaxID=157183 RepID=A0A9N8Q9S9_9BASI|nr:hypothetical protein CF335_g8544 [Tilletia laevis]KAE8182863.1 hypothetical protein CF328_g8372 [Tilletia controversa]CAD6914506.1 unnamed protein product [Tilletia laevis]